MSAHNLLKCIPYEIGYKKLDDTKLDFYAFIVLSVFKSLCISDKTNIPLLKMPIINSKVIRGWLHQLFINKKNSLCILNFNDPKLNDKIYILSHGGVPKALIDNPKILTDIPTNLQKNITLASYLTNAKTYYTYISSKLQKGGFTNTTTNEVTFEQLQLTINDINTVFQICITQICNTPEMDKPDHNMLFIFILSSGFNCSKYMNGNPICDIPTSEDTGPIMPGIWNMRNPNMIFTIKGRTIYQIYGHKPIGYSTIVDMFENNTDKVFLINLDTSMSYKDTELNKTKDSQTYIQIKNNIITIHSKIIIPTRFEFTPIKYDLKYRKTTIIDSLDIKKLQPITISNRFYVSPLFKTYFEKYGPRITITNNINDEKFISYLKNTCNNIKNSNSKNNNINFHGYIKINNIDYVVFTHTTQNNPGDVRGNLLILNNEDFSNFIDESKTDAFKNKYLKYKQKYLNLKKMYVSN